MVFQRRPSAWQIPKWFNNGIAANLSIFPTTPNMICQN